MFLKPFSRVSYIQNVYVIDKNGLFNNCPYFCLQLPIFLLTTAHIFAYNCPHFFTAAHFSHSCPLKIGVKGIYPIIKHYERLEYYGTGPATDLNQTSPFFARENFELQFKIGVKGIYPIIKHYERLEYYGTGPATRFKSGGGGGKIEPKSRPWLSEEIFLM